MISLSYEVELTTHDGHAAPDIYGHFGKAVGEHLEGSLLRKVAMVTIPLHASGRSSCYPVVMTTGMIFFIAVT